MGQQHSESPTGERQNHALRQKLAGETRTPRAQRRANSKFVLAGQASPQKQIRQVSAGYEQNETHRDRQKQQGCGHVAVFDAVFLDGFYRYAPAFVCVRMSLGDALRNRTHLRGCLFCCDSRLEPGENSQESLFAPSGGNFFARESERNPHPRLEIP